MGRLHLGGGGSDSDHPDRPGGIVMMESIYTLCGIIAVSGIVMGTIFGLLWLLGITV
jgi:hypothetical protein